MTHHIDTTVQVTHDDPPPTIDITQGRLGLIPTIDFATAYNVRLTIQLGLHRDPERWLRETAERLNALADLVRDQQREAGAA